jgi:sugar transferase (PEP-CTERM system associated)
MVRLFNVYYPIRTLLLVLSELVLVFGSFLLAEAYKPPTDLYISLLYENGLAKILGITVLTILLSYYFDLYEPRRISAYWEINFRLLLVLSVLCFLLAGIIYVVPDLYLGPHILTIGISILAITLLLWRFSYEWLIDFPAFRERVYVLGSGTLARMVVQTLQERRDCGMDVIQCDSPRSPASSPRERFASELHALAAARSHIDRVIVALEDCRGAMPVRELLDLRLRGVVVQDTTSLIERLSGKFPLEALNPSAFIFAHGFHVKAVHRVIQRSISFSVALFGMLICLPFIPPIMLAVRLSSPGPIFFRQKRVGLHGKHFWLAKFRTMRQDAEANGAVWATRNDTRVTPLGRFMRKTRLDEIPQLWNVLRGDMDFVGPRPERPEFVEWLAREIPYYELRHMMRPGLTGWAQVRYRYGASLEETRKKLEYDLYYLKHKSVGLDLLIMFETFKTIILGRGAQ